MLTQLYRNSSVTNHFNSLFFIFFLLLHVSTQAQSSWNQLGADIDGSPGDGQGASVSISADGLTLATASPSATVSGNPFTGLVRVYEKIGASWIQKGADIPGEAENDNFGASVSISDDGDLLAIGAPFKDLTSSGSPNGRVKVYEWSGSAWIQKGSNLDGVEDLENFGEGLSLSGDGTRLSVGIPGQDTNGGTAGGGTGAVRVYEYTTDWTLLGSEIVGDVDFSSFGTSVSLDQTGVSLAVGAPLDTTDTGGANAGKVSVYRFNGTSWEAKGSTLSTFTGDEEDAFGQAVSLSNDGNRLAVGAPDSFFGFGPTYIGYVQVWEYASETWTQLGDDIVSNFDGDKFGNNIQLSGDGTHLTIGAIENFDTNNPNGRAQVWKLNSTIWEQVGNDIMGESADDAGGTAVAISDDGSIAAIGSPLNDGGGADAGHVRVFEFGVADIVAPVVTVDMLTTSDQTPAITGTIDDNAATISVTVAGQTQDATNNQDGTWILADNTLTSLDEGTYDVSVSATDEASNIGTDATVDELVIDLTPPTVTIDTLYTNDQTPALTGTIDDNEATISVTVDEQTYNATNNADGTWTLADNTLPELAEGEYTVSVTATDEFENESDPEEGLLDIDITSPDIYFLNGLLSGNVLASEPVNVQPILVKVVFAELPEVLSEIYQKVEGFNLDDISISGNVSSSLSTVQEDETFTLVLTLDNPNVNQEITIEIPEGAATDLAGNPTKAGTVTITYDVEGPVITSFETTGSTNAATIPTAVTFDELTREVSVEDFTIENGEIAELTTDTDSLIYTFNVVPTTEGEVTVQLQEASVEDKLGNTNVAASEVLSFIYDLTPPTVEITTEAGVANVSPVVATITFSEEVDLIVDILTITGGTVTDLSTSDNVVYSLEITPTAPEDAPITGFDINVGIEAGKVQDAAGNINSEGAETTILFDDVVPVASFSTVAATGNFEGLITFSELENSSLSESDIEVTNGTLSNYAEIPGSNGTTLFALAVTVETGTEEVLISIPSGVVSDAAGNTNTATTFTVAIDNVAPTVVVTSTAENPTNISPIPVTFTFSEKVNKRTGTIISVSSGFSLGDLETEDGITFTAAVTPTVEEGTLSLTVGAGVYADLAGNQNVASETFTLAYDAKAPVLTIDAPEAVNSTDPFNISFTFDEAVASFDETNVTVTNGTLGAITADGNTFTSQVTPAGEGEITITVSDILDELGNEAVEASKTILFDAVAPTVAITGVEGTVISPEPEPVTLTLTFSEEVIGFTESDIEVTNGTNDNFQKISETVYTTIVTPVELGTVTISIAENAVEDAVGNGNEAVIFSFIYDRKYSGGAGTLQDPYLIASLADLVQLGNTEIDQDKHFKQISDIDLQTAAFDGLSNYTFRGSYDGGGHAIRGLQSPLFKYIFSSHFIKNLTLSEIAINTNFRGGSLVESIFDSDLQISNVYASGEITTQGFAGGLVGESLKSKLSINNCSVNISFSNESSDALIRLSAGLVGIIGDDQNRYNDEVIINNSYTDGSIIGSTIFRSGFIGFAPGSNTNIIIENSYTRMSFGQEPATWPDEPFLFIGEDQNLDITVLNSFWDRELTGLESSSTGGTGLSTTEMRKRETFANAGWDLTDTWSHLPGYHPVLKSQVENAKPFTISGTVVDENGQPFTGGTVKAILLGFLENKTTEIGNDGSFILEGIPAGLHSIVVEPTDNNYVKTFYGDANREALSKHVLNSISSIQIQMIAKSDPNQLTGNGVVNGRVVDAGAGNGRIVQGRILEGEGLEGVTVFLVRTSDEEILTQVETDANGDFEITGIPAGDYQLLLDVVGIDVNLEGSSFTMDEEGTPLTISAAVSEDGISFAIEEVLGIADELEILVYPNPVKEFLNVKVAGNATIKLMNLSGVVLHMETFTGEVKVDVSKLAEGVHFIEVLNKNGRSIRKLVKNN